MREILKIFEGKPIRTFYDENMKKWYFSGVDIIKLLTESSNPDFYWEELKRNLSKNGESLTDKYLQKEIVKNDKLHWIDLVDTEQLAALIPLIPQKKSENLKQWAKKISEKEEQATDVKKQVYDDFFLTLKIYSGLLAVVLCFIGSIYLVHYYADLDKPYIVKFFCDFALTLLGSILLVPLFMGKFKKFFKILGIYIIIAFCCIFMVKCQEDVDSYRSEKDRAWPVRIVE